MTSVSSIQIGFTSRLGSRRERQLCRLCNAWRLSTEMQPLRIKQHWSGGKTLLRYLCGQCISLILQEATKW